VAVEGRELRDRSEESEDVVPDADDVEGMGAGSLAGGWDVAIWVGVAMLVWVTATLWM
jgi:hypothetical protein